MAPAINATPTAMIAHKNAFGSATAFSYAYAPAKPNAPPIHMIPGVPRFR